MSFGHEIIIAIIGSGALSAAISAVVAVINNRQRQRHGVAAGTRMILYDRVKFLCKQYIGEGFIAADCLEDLIEMHRIYHDELGGNGYLDALIEQAKKLPIKS